MITPFWSICSKAPGKASAPTKTGGYVRVETIQVEQKDERDCVIRAKVTGLIQELRGRVACGDIAVLTRNNVQGRTDDPLAA